MADWLDLVTRGLERFTALIDPGAPVGPETRDHKRGALLWAPRHPHRRVAQIVREAERDMERWQRALLRAHPDDAPGVRLLGQGGLTLRQETEGLALVGAPGTGKTVTLRRIIQQALQRGDLVVVHDAKGEYSEWLLAAYPMVTALLAPWDRRARPWVLGEDLCTRLDAQDGAAAFIPEVVGDRNPFWRAAARGVLEGVLLTEIADHTGTDAPWSWRDLWDDWFSVGRTATARRLARSAEGRAAASTIAGDAVKASSEDVWATLLSIIAPLKHLAAAWPEAAPARSISVRAWLAGASSQVVILPTLSQYHELGKVVARLWVEASARQLLSMPDSATRRVWFVLDEVPVLGDLPALLRLTTHSRAKGGRVAMGTQDLGQLRAAWGRDRATALLNSCAALMVFRTSDPDLAEYSARALGRREVTEWSPSSGEHHGHDDSRSSGWSAHTREEFVVMPSELAQLPPLVAYTRVAGWPQVMPWRWTPPEELTMKAPVVDEAAWVSEPIALDVAASGGARPSIPPPPPVERERPSGEQERPPRGRGADNSGELGVSR